MISDLTLDDDDSKPDPGAAMLLREKEPDAVLRLLCQMRREGARPEFRGAGKVLFLREVEETKETVWDDLEAAKWRKIMGGWGGRDPTIEEAMAWKANAEARLEIKFWERIQAARQSAKSGGP